MLNEPRIVSVCSKMHPDDVTTENIRTIVAYMTEDILKDFAKDLDIKVSRCGHFPSGLMWFLDYSRSRYHGDEERIGEAKLHCCTNIRRATRGRDVWKRR